MQTLTLPSLNYDYNALEPFISAEIMELHHSKHHQGYVNQWNLALEKHEVAVNAGNMEEVIELERLLRFHGGGYWNHCLFWESLAPVSQGGGELSDSSLKSAIIRQFGSLETLIELMNKKTVGVPGSGWGWLIMDRTTKNLWITTSLNQDLFSPCDAIALLNIDVWEHAYYLQYKQQRIEYVKNIWKVMNWKEISRKYEVGLQA